MSVIILPTGNLGPFKSIEVLADRLRADNTDYPFTVIGSYTISADNSLAPPPPAPDPQIIQDAIVAATQKRLDDFGLTRGYSSTDSLAKYQNISDAEIAALPVADQATVTKFRIECRYLAVKIAQTWSVLYTGLAEVQAGTRQMPTGFADIEPLLPVLAWPA